MNSRNDGRTTEIVGALHTMRSVMPVSRTICGGIDRPGSTSVANSPSTSPPLTLTAPNSVIDSVADDPPVVSRSTTTKVISRSGSPSSSKLCCCLSRTAVLLVLPMGRTLEARTDSHGSFRASVRHNGDVSAPDLPNPVRAMIVNWASETLGQLPAAQIPPVLVRVAKFAPAKRGRVAAAALAQAVESDAGFRAAVADRARAARADDDPVREAALAHVLGLPAEEELMNAVRELTA